MLGYIYLKCIAGNTCVCACMEGRKRLMVKDRDRGRREKRLHWCVAGGLLQ